MKKNEEDIMEDVMKRIDELSFEKFKFRMISLEDYNKGYFELLEYLTVSPKPKFEDWEIQYNKILRNSVYIFVIEDSSKDLIVGSISCLIEEKFIRNLGKVSHIEDVVVHPDYRNRKFGAKLLNWAINFSKIMNCYKAILDSKVEAVGFYEKYGFQKKSEGMALYFNS